MAPDEHKLALPAQQTPEAITSPNFGYRQIERVSPSTQQNF